MSDSPFSSVRMISTGPRRIVCPEGHETFRSDIVLDPILEEVGGGKFRPTWSYTWRALLNPGGAGGDVDVKYSTGTATMALGLFFPEGSLEPRLVFHLEVSTEATAVLDPEAYSTADDAEIPEWALTDFVLGSDTHLYPSV